MVGDQEALQASTSIASVSKRKKVMNEETAETPHVIDQRLCYPDPQINTLYTL
jgi:hypothetical protein